MKNSKIFMTMDVSGSVNRSKRILIYEVYKAFKEYLTKHFNLLDPVIIGHTTTAFLSNEDIFFNYKMKGGTYLSSGVSLINNEDLCNEYNFLIIFSDGDNWGEDDICFLKKIHKLKDIFDHIFYVEISSHDCVSTIASKMNNEFKKTKNVTNLFINTTTYNENGKLLKLYVRLIKEFEKLINNVEEKNMKSLRKRFCMDYNIPIDIFEDEYFYYFLDLYDSLYDCKRLYNVFLQSVDKIGGKEEYFNYQSELIEKISTHIKEKPEYVNFNNMDMSKYKPIINLNQKNIYSNANANKYFISIDLKHANFGSLKFIDPNIIDNKSCYEDFLRQFTDDEYIINSKKIRQVIFGQLNVSRQQTIQKYIISNVANELLKIIDIKDIESASSDEIVIAANDYSFADIKNLVNQLAIKMDISVNIEEFILEELSNNKFGFIKENIFNKSIKFKSVSKQYFAQAYKEYFNLPINEKDLTFYYEGKLAKFI